MLCGLAAAAAEQALVPGVFRALPADELLSRRPDAAGERLTLRVQCGAWLAANVEFKNASQPLCPAAELNGSFDELLEALTATQLRLRSVFDAPTQQSMLFRVLGPAGAITETRLSLFCFGALPLLGRGGAVVLDPRRPGEQQVGEVDPVFARWFPPGNFVAELQPALPGVSALFRGRALLLIASGSGQGSVEGVVWLRTRDPVSGLVGPALSLRLPPAWTAPPASAGPWVLLWVLGLLLGVAGLVAAVAVARLRRAPSDTKPEGQSGLSTQAEPSSQASIVEWNRRLLARRQATARSAQPGSPPRSLHESFDNLSVIAADEPQSSDRSSFAEEIKL